MTSFGAYELLGEVARGGMGVVYRARHRLTGQEVALKRLLVGDGASPEQLGRFLREARACTRLRHPNVVRVHDVGEHEGCHFFTMDLVDGVSLAELLAGLDEAHGPTVRLSELVSRSAASRAAPRAGEAGNGELRPAPGARLPLTQVLVMMVKVVRAVQHAHEHGIVHRDLKPSNVMVDRDGEPVVMDFGLARLAEGAAAGATRTGEVLGTPQYMAPEQALGLHREVDERTDVYALGAMLYELVTGSPAVPPSGQLVLDLLRVVEAEPVAPRRLNPRLPPEVELIVGKALDKEPARRYQSARALADDLERFLGGDPVAARRPSLAYRLRKAAVKHRRRLAAAALVVAAAATVVGWQVQQVLRERWGWVLELEETFDGTTLDSHWQAHGGAWQVAGGELVGEARDNAYLLLDRPLTGDLRLEWEATCEAATEHVFLETAAVMNASTERLDEDGYFVSIGSQDGLKIQSRGHNVVFDTGVRPVAGELVRVRLERIGRRLAVAVDGVEVGVYEDPLPVTGSGGRDRVGLYLYDARTRVDNLRVWSRGAALVVSVLEKGDVLFERGLFADAADEYAVIRRTRAGTTEAWEAAYREGLCALERARAATDPEAARQLAAAAGERFTEVVGSGPEPLASFAQAGLAELADLAGDPGEALTIACRGADANRALRAAVRPLIGRVESLTGRGFGHLVPRFAAAAAALYPEDARLLSNAWIAEALWQREQGDVEAALASFDRLHERLADFPAYLVYPSFEQARTLAMLGRPREALDALDAPYGFAALERGVIESLLGDATALPRAITLCVERYADSSPGWAVAAAVAGELPAELDEDEEITLTYARAVVARASGRHEEARRLLVQLERATSSRPRTAWPRWEVASLLAATPPRAD